MFQCADGWAIDNHQQASAENFGLNIFLWPRQKGPKSRDVAQILPLTGTTMLQTWARELWGLMRGGWLNFSPAADLVKNGGLSMKHAGLRMNDGDLTLLSQPEIVIMEQYDMQICNMHFFLGPTK